jgi:SWI/SNF-related matrix-associated actin-dependent regulator 1 of chromatin subfamily A
VVIVTKASTKYQWKREWEKLTTVHPTVLEGQGPQVVSDTDPVGSITAFTKDIPPSARVLILNWDILPHWMPAIREWQRGAHLSVVYDEIHRGKNWKRKEKYVNGLGQTRWRSADNQASAAADLSARAYRRLGLTATPVRNRLSDLWAQLDLVEPGCWGSNWDWAHRYCNAKPGEYGGLNTNGKSNLTELNLRLKEVCHIVKFEEMARELPPKRRQLCYLSHAEQSRPSAFSQDMKRAAKAGRQALFEMKLLEAASRKRKWIVDIVTDAVANKQKVVVFTGRRQDCERLGEAITAVCDKLQAPCWWAHGGHSGKAREEMAQVYASYDGPCAFVGTTDAFGEAIDGLQHTDLAIFGLLPWTPGQLVQAEGRFSRKGQTRPVLITYTVAEGTVDEHVADLLLEKLEGISDEMISEASGVAATLAQEGKEDEIVAALLAKLEDQE